MGSDTSTTTELVSKNCVTTPSTVKFHWSHDLELLCEVRAHTTESIGATTASRNGAFQLTATTGNYSGSESRKGQEACRSRGNIGAKSILGKSKICAPFDGARRTRNKGTARCFTTIDRCPRVLWSATSDRNRSLLGGGPTRIGASPSSNDV